MELSKPEPYPKNPSTRWKCRPDRNLSGPESFRNFKSRTRRADMKPLTEEQQILAARFLPLARALARPFKDLFAHWKDEFESAACLALVEAARSFDPARNIRFATFARFRVRGALVDVGRMMGIPCLDEDAEDGPGVVTLTPYSEEHGQVLIAMAAPPVGSDFEAIDSVEHMLLKLPRKHATVCRMQYLFGKTQAEIADVLGCSQAEVTRLHMKALELLSEPYDSDGKLNRAMWRRRRAARKRKPSKVVGPDPVLA